MKNYAQMFGLLGYAHSVMFASSNPVYFNLTLSVDNSAFPAFVRLYPLLSKKYVP